MNIEKKVPFFVVFLKFARLSGVDVSAMCDKSGQGAVRGRGNAKKCVTSITDVS